MIEAACYTAIDENGNKNILTHLQPRTLRPKRKRKEESLEVPNNLKYFNL